MMYFDPILGKMVPGIFAPLNNKSSVGYNQVFAYIKEYIFQTINNDIKKLKWESFTSDFEEALFSSFKHIFHELKKIKHNGCFFHFLKISENI